MNRRMKKILENWKGRENVDKFGVDSFETGLDNIIILVKRDSKRRDSKLVTFSKLVWLLIGRL